MTKEEATRLKALVDAKERSIVTVVEDQLHTLKGLIDALTKKE